jgi:hypothetical protein
MKSGGTG